MSVIDTALKQAYEMFKKAMELDEKRSYPEAHKLYLSTSSYITETLGSCSVYDEFYNSKSEKLLGFAKMCIDGAMLTNKSIMKQRSMDASNECKSNSTNQPIMTHQINPTHELPQHSNEAHQPDQIFEHSETNDDDDDALLSSILDSLPDVPCSKPAGVPPTPLKKASTLPILPTQNTEASSSSLYKVSHIDRAEEQNMLIMGKYKRISQKRELKTHERLAIIRAQEENRMIANQQEEMLQRKLKERKLRLEQELSSAARTRQDSYSDFDIVLFGKEELMKRLSQSIKEYNIQNSKSIDQNLDRQSQMQTKLDWFLCKTPPHPIGELMDLAQYNFHKRISPLNKKMYLATSKEKSSLLPGITAEVKTIVHDTNDFLFNLIRIICTVDKIFICEEDLEGPILLNTQLSKLMFKTILKPLIDVYKFIKQPDLEIFKDYLSIHHNDDIRSFTDVNPKYHLGQSPYSAAIDALRDVLNANSPVEKLSLLPVFSKCIGSSIRQFYTDSGVPEEKAIELAAFPADDLVPITAYIITRLNNADLLPEMLLVDDVTPEDDLRGHEGYCLANVCICMKVIMERHSRSKGQS